MSEKTINVINPFGEPENIPESSLKSALQANYRIADANTVQAAKDQAQYGDGIGNELKAFGLGALRGTTLGGSDQLLTHFGAAQPETLEKLKQYNPKSSVAGEFAGIGASLALMPEAAGVEGAAEALRAAQATGDVAKVAEATRGLSAAKNTLTGLDALNPASAVAKLGGKALGAAAPMVGTAADFLANPETSAITNRILQSAGTHAIGSAVEGAAFGLGQSVSENALGDPDAFGEKLLANVGHGAVLGGILGAGVGTLSGALGLHPARPVSDIVSDIKSDMGDIRAASNPENLSHALDEMQITPERKEDILSGLQKRKDNADEIIEAAGTIGAPVLESQISASKHVQDVDSMLMQSPTPIGVGRQQVLQRGLDATTKAVDDALGPASEMSQAEVGNVVKQGLVAKFQALVDPISKLYNKIKESTVDIDVKAQSLTRIANNIRELGGPRPSAPEAQLASAIADEIASIKTVNDIKEFKSSIQRQIKGNPALKYVGNQITSKLGELEENTIINYAKKEYNVPVGERQTVLDLIEERKTANAKYKSMMEQMGEIGAVSGKKKIYGPQDFINFIEDLTPEQLQKRLFAKGNSEFVGFFKENFPEEWDKLSQFEKTRIRDASFKDGHIQPAKVLGEIKKLSPELKQAMFGEGDLKKLEASKTWLEALPANLNPSGTSKSEAYRRFFEKPLSSFFETVKDAAALRGIKGVVGHDSQKIDGLINLERRGNQITQKIQSAVKGIFENSDTYSGLAGSKLDFESHEKQAKELNAFVANPQHLLDTLDTSTQDLYQVAPNVSQALQASTMRAVQFLQAKVPKSPGIPRPLSPKFKPSNSDLSKFHRYLHAIQEPTTILDQIGSGIILPETLEAVGMVYPKMLHEMRAAVMDELSNHVANETHLPYAKKLALSGFLGMDLDDSTTSQSIAMSQATMAQLGQEQAKNQAQAHAKVSKQGLGKLAGSSQMLTPMQATAQRGNGGKA